jgi:hypothetical protein
MTKSLSLLALLLGATPALANPPGGGMGIMPMQPIKVQIRQNATSAGLLANGNTLKIRETSPGLYRAEVRGVGGLTGNMPNSLLKFADFKVGQVSEGKEAQIVGGWQQVESVAGAVK